MKFPKNRAYVYLVSRRAKLVAYPTGTGVVLGVFSSLEGADNFRDACKQEWIDQVGNNDEVSFHVDISIFYAD